MKVFSLVDLISKAQQPEGIAQKIIAIDGCGGAGKSTLASLLATALNSCSVVHTDDFASWDNAQGWFPRMLSEVLESLGQNKAAKFQRFDWNLKNLNDWVTIEPQKFVILEGVTSSRKEFRPFLSFSIFVKTDSNLRLSRGITRDGLQAKDQWLKWIS